MPAEIHNKVGTFQVSNLYETNMWRGLLDWGGTDVNAIPASTAEEVMGAWDWDATVILAAHSYMSSSAASTPSADNHFMSATELMRSSHVEVCSYLFWRISVETTLNLVSTDCIYTQND